MLENDIACQVHESTRTFFRSRSLYRRTRICCHQAPTRPEILVAQMHSVWDRPIASRGRKPADHQKPPLDAKSVLAADYQYLENHLSDES